MHLSITNNVTPAEKEELFVGLRAYNGQFLDMATFREGANKFLI